MYIYKLKERNKTYNVLLCNNLKNIDIMINIFKKYMKTNNKIIGIDFEFRRISKVIRDVALFQINLENDTNEATICIFNPKQLNNEQYKILIKLLTKQDIIKVIHGAESLVKKNIIILIILKILLVLFILLLLI